MVTTPQISSACHATVCAGFDRQVSWLNAVLALIVALGIQIGTNYVNDYADGVRGTDEHRVGPVRLVAGKLATVREVEDRGLDRLRRRRTGRSRPGRDGHLVARPGRPGLRHRRVGIHRGPPTLRVPRLRGAVRVRLLRARRDGGVGVRAARPFVISLAGHLFTYRYDWWFLFWAGVPVGLLAAALLQANNLRDIATDTESGKKTLAVRLGRKCAGLFYCFTLMGVALSIGVLSSYRPWALLALLALPVAIAPLRLALSDEGGRVLLPMLGTTSRLQILAGALLAIGLLL